MAPINHLGFHLGTYRSALADEGHFSWWPSYRIFPDFPLQHRLSIKTLIGHKLSELELHSSEYLIGTKLSDGHDGFLVLLGNSDGLPITIPQLLSKALLHLLEMFQAKYQIGGDEITYSCCIGIPIYFTHMQRSIVQKAARQAGFTSIALVHETTAVALELKNGLKDYPYVVLVDMGVISIQVSVVKYRKDIRPQILSHAFDSSLGGRAFDMVLVNHFVVKFRDECGIDATSEPDLYRKLYSACEKMKIELSSCEEMSFKLTWGDNELIGSMKRVELERMCAPLLERVKGPLEKALDNAGLSVEAIYSIQCVGSASQVPAIIKILTDFFQREPIHAKQNDHLVSRGCSKQGYYTSQNVIPRKIKDILPFSIVMSWNTKEVTIEGDGQSVVFPKGCPMEDTMKKISFSASFTFSVGFKYSDIIDPIIITRIGRFKIGPFQSKICEKVQGEFTVRLDKNGIFGVESAYILEDGNKVELQVSRLNELEELAGELNQQEQLDLREKLEKTEHMLIEEREKQKQLQAQVEQLESSRTQLNLLKKEAEDVAQQNQKELLDTQTQLQEIKTLLAIEKEKRNEIEGELTRFKREARNESQHEQTKNELEDIRSLLETEKEKSTKLGDELANVRKEFEKQNKIAEFSCAEVQEATNDFNDANKIGEGGYGCVYKGVIHCTNVAIKVIKKESYQGQSEFDQEVETLQKVRHPNLVTLIGACREKWALVYEFLPKGNLEECLRNDESRRSLCWRKRIQIASNICSALVFLHHTKPHAIVHGDLKPANIFLDSTYKCKLGDFGTCRLLKLITDTTPTPYHKTEEPRGTYCYFDPEYYETRKLTTHTDVFGYGVVLLQLVTGKEAWALRALVENALESGKFNEVVDASANWPLDVAEKMARLGLSCIEWKKKDRPDLAEDVWIEIESMEQVASCS